MNWSSCGRTPAPPAREIEIAIERLTPPLHFIKKKESAMEFKLNVNGAVQSVDVDGDIALLWVLRDVLGLTGTKFGCGMALCGACTVHLNGQPVRSCVTPVEAVGTGAVTTIEIIGQSPVGRKVQQVWIATEVPQCGYCQSGQIMAAAALLRAKPNPTDADIDQAMSGNVCRCGTYARIRAAIKQASREIAATRS
jgi:isoquinoline 1-oxidoreductase alpha subunit